MVDLQRPDVTFTHTEQTVKKGFGWETCNLVLHRLSFNSSSV